MKIQTTIGLLTATVFALASFSAAAQGGKQQGGAQPQDRAQVERGQRDFDRDRMQDRDRATTPSRDRDRDRDQDRTNAPDNAKYGDSEIYGSELMSTQERNQYREQLRLTESDPQAQTKLKAQHEEQMRVRAKEQGVKLGEPETNGGEK